MVNKDLIFVVISFIELYSLFLEPYRRGIVSYSESTSCEFVSLGGGEILQPPCSVEMKAMVSLFSIAYSVVPSSSQSVSLISTMIPGLTVPAYTNISSLSLM